MKIFCIGRNYSEHAKELGNDVPRKPMVFMKPATALLIKNRPFYYPDFSNDIHYEAEIVLRFSKNGRHIKPEFAHKYYDAIAFGIDFTARDLQRECKRDGHPWEIAKSFDHSAAISEFLPISTVDQHAIKFRLEKNEEVVQSGSTADLIFDYAELIAHISQFFRIQQGDILYTGTPAGVGPVSRGDQLTGYIEDMLMLKCAIK